MSPVEKPSPARTRKVLVTGGSRSGKSRHAEGLLAAEPRVIYVAPGPVPDQQTDAEWADRIELHRRRRPSHWETVETIDLAGALRRADAPVIVDDLGTWLTAAIDRRGTWDLPLREWRSDIERDLSAVSQAWREAPGTCVAVTSEVGMGLVSEHRSGRVFTDLLGELNTRIAELSDDVILVVAGRALRL